jgi:hypothetical protein
MALLTPVMPDHQNPPLTDEEAANNRILAFHNHMREALHQSLIAAFLIFGFPGDGRRGACLQDKKWDQTISHIMMYLGYLINS